MFSFKKPKGILSEYRYIGNGKNKLKLLIVRPKEKISANRPGVLWIHGGGYFVGMPEMIYMGRAIDLVTKGGAVVVSPDYTLSFRAPYPQALLECYEALLYMKENAEELGIRSDQIMVGGESAGGGMTAALCMYAKDRHTVRIAYQMPLYPMLDYLDTDSSRNNWEKVWNTRRNHLAWNLYLRQIKNAPQIPEYASPAHRKDFSGLPPCYTFVGDIEPFYRETLDYVQNLKNAGVEAKVDVYPEFYHAYDMMNPKATETKKVAEKFLEQFLFACQHYTAKQDEIL